ncbi:MAG: anhydro-N-acetylmuramic acid kinase [Vulcanimicrobiaceae bacterium]
MRAIGLMSGTSLDGIDAVVVDVRARATGVACEMRRFATVPFADALRARLVAALPPNVASAAEVVALDRDLGDALAAAAREVAADERVDFVASHGLTLYHDGDARTTLQIGDPYRIRDAVGATVVCDFRRADCALGGVGAPLVPYVDALLFASDARDTVALNLGGIANVTVLRAKAPIASATAWDTGPGNMLVDAIVAQRTGGRERFDRGGERAARGTIVDAVLHALVASEAFYFVQPPPKSTGRERFGTQFLDAHAEYFADMPLDDACATLTAYTVTSIGDSLDRYGPARARLVVSGGGAHNATLVAGLVARLPSYEVVLSRAVGVDPDAKEALAFAILGYETLRGRPANVPSATGASRPSVLGAIVPHELAALLARIASEDAAATP